MQGTRIAVAAAMLLSLATAAHASDFDIYAGAFGGWGGSRIWSNHDPALGQRTYPVIQRHAYGTFGGGYVGLGWSVLAVEAGWLELPHYHSYVEGTNPNRATIQGIDGHGPFLRGLLRAPLSWSIRPYAFGGVVEVRAHSMEVAVMPGTWNYGQSWRVDMKARRPYVGAGVEVPLYGAISGRAEFGYIPRASSSFWSGTRDYTLGSLALQWRF